MLLKYVLRLTLSAVLVLAQSNSFPHNYPGIPSEAYGPVWQDYFKVTEQLPGAPESIAQSYAGNIAVNREGHRNNTLFFWAFEKEDGSLTASTGERSNEPWVIWLNGGPGSSSLIGLLRENGPILVQGDGSLAGNDYSWNKLADTFWLDQPVGTGYSTVEEDAAVLDQEELGQDFLGFLSNLVAVFPTLRERPMYLTGESYAGRYIPYMAKAMFSTPNPPVNLKKIAIGNGVMGNDVDALILPTLTIIETFPQLINYDEDVFNYFKEQEHLCEFDLNFTYPQNGRFPTLNSPYESDFSGRFTSSDLLDTRSALRKKFEMRLALHASTAPDLSKRDREVERRIWKRQVSLRPTGMLDPWYGCFLWDELLDYAFNFSFPWRDGGIDVYNIPNALFPQVELRGEPFLNDNFTRAAIHAPTSKDWQQSIRTPFFTGRYDPSPSPIEFLSELATNASERGVGIIFYSGNDDALVAHRGTEVVIQNMTFGGIQGFTRKPSTPFTDDHGNFAGIVHQERNLTYALFYSAGHLVPEQAPEAAYVFLREFILGSSVLGLVTDSGNAANGGEYSELAGDALAATPVIYYGSSSTQFTTTAPAATVSAWENFIATATIASTALGTEEAETDAGTALVVKADGILTLFSLIFAVVFM